MRKTVNVGITDSEAMPGVKIVHQSAYSLDRMQWFSNSLLIHDSHYHISLVHCAHFNERLLKLLPVWMSGWDFRFTACDYWNCARYEIYRRITRSSPTIAALSGMFDIKEHASLNSRSVSTELFEPIRVWYFPPHLSSAFELFQGR